jgi:co-chaperonin GroES (HSP10)
MATTINFEPTRDWVVLPVKNTEKTEAGIILPESVQKTIKTNILPVVAAGPACEHIKVGQTVMVHPTTEGLIIDVDGVSHVMVNEFMICGIIPDKK